MNIVIFTGAGMSAESGLPTFRTDNGLWENHKVEDVCTQEGFRRNPQLVWGFYQERYLNYDSAAPNDGHRAITKLQQFCDLNDHQCTIITQNVDALHQRAGTGSVIELHGSIRKFKCNSCEYTTDDNLWDSTKIPVCATCGDHIRPAVVWFGEQLPPSIEPALDLASAADITLVVGTTAAVYPAANIAVVGHSNNKGMVHEFNLVPYLGWLAARGRYQFWRGPCGKSLPMFVENFINQHN